MSFKSIANSITGYFNQVATTNNFVVRYDDDPGATPTVSLWMRASVDFGDSQQITAGVKQFRNPGIFTVMIHQSVGSGISALLSAADVVAEAFRAQIVSGVNFQTPKIKNAGREKDDWIVTVLCPFFVDEN